MDLLDLKIFKQLYLQRNITAVSKGLFLSQPTVSYRLKKMQDELDVKLYDYNGQFLFNEKSKLLFEYCVKVLNSYDLVLERLHENERYGISLSSISTRLYQAVLFKACLELHVFPHIRSCTSEEAIVDVLENRSRIAIVGGISESLNASMDVLPLKNEKIYFVYNDQCDGDISNTPLVLDQINSGIRHNIEEYIQQFKTIKIVGEVGTTSHRLTLINEQAVGMFIQETYLNKTNQYEHIKISDTCFFDHNISLVAKKKELETKTSKDIIKYLNRIN